MAPSETETSPASQDDPTVSPERWRILFVLLVTIVMTLISVSIVNVALPAIRVGLGATASDLQWVLSGYALTFGVVLVMAGRAGDIMGRGGLFLIGVTIFTLASIAAGLAPDAHSLNAARFVQGVGSGILNPQGLGMIQHYFRGKERGKAFGYFGTAIGFSVAVGPVLGGVLIELGGADIGWRLTFLVNVPIGILAIILGLMWFPRPLIIRLPRIGSGLRSLDPIGAALLGLAVLAVLFPFVESGGNPWIWLLLPLGLLLLWLWVKWEQHYLRLGHSPMVDLKIFTTKSYSNGITIMALYFMGVSSIWVLVALYIQEGDGRSALESAYFGIPAALLSAYAAHWAGSRVLTLGRKLIVAGLALALIGLLLSVAAIALHEIYDQSIWWLIVSLSFIGVAQGLVISPNQTLTLAEVPLAYAGSSGAILQTGQRIGTAIGIAFITAATFSTLAVSNWATAISVGFGMVGVVVVLAMLVALKDMRDRV
ncbi:MFS transporter [Pararhodobacter oceanensis]|uniref:MFS transporter n=1 Tax=Pararhodobacter oceanensis TaxID=2172121 RepID=A0A2T8HXQ1_9RHOB|nr:MFS transporter [Pararhodobacter oceanensis]